MLILIVIFWTAWALILYTYALFPLLLAFCARLRGRPASQEAHPAADESLPRVTMVVAAYNEAGVLPAKLANTWQIDYPQDRFTLLVGSDGSADETPRILQACPDPRLRSHLFTQRRGKISVLNDLLKAVDTDIVVMSDANTMFAPDAVRKLVRHFENPRVGCVSGELSLEQDGGVSGEGLYWRYECWIKRNEGRLGFLIGCNGGIFALRRALYEPLPASTIVEDFVLTMRVIERGYLVRFEPEARATEPPCPSARAEMVRKVRIGAGGWQALGLTRALLHPRYGLCAFAFWGHKVLRWLVPLLLLMALAANAGLAGLALYRLLLALQVGGALIAAWAYPGRRLPRWTRPISYFYLMNYALFCGFLRFLFGTQRVTWDRASSPAHA
ncbi:MAG TPA: glycosyltransferase family 2 protein [Chthonomonadaceae bacterium]|nr:glycosyltransferase family 2 protein [Chthonomonadaceae bacterium]